MRRRTGAATSRTSRRWPTTEDSGVAAAPDRWSQWLGERRDAGDDGQRRVWRGRLTAIRDRVLDQAGGLDGATLLDVGCGDGLIGLEALDRVGQSGTVLFADISPALLEQAEKAASDLGLADRARFVHTDAVELGGIADGSVDVITTRSVLIYVVDKPAAFAAMHRVLRPEGRISLFEPINALMYPEPREQLWGYDIAPLVDLADQIKREYKRLSGPETQTMLDFDDRDLVRWATEAGFPEVRLTLHHEVVPGAMRATSFDTFLDGAPNPLAPTLRETIDSALDGPERQQLLDYLHSRFTTTLPIQHWAVAYLQARRSYKSTDSASGISGA